MSRTLVSVAEPERPQLLAAIARALAALIEGAQVSDERPVSDDVIERVGGEYADQIDIVARALGADAVPEVSCALHHIAERVLKALALAGYTWVKEETV